MAEAVLKIGMDTTEFTTKMERAGDTVKKAGDKTTKTIEQMLQTLTSITPRLMGIAGAIAAVNQVAVAANSIAKTQSSDNRAAGSRNMQILDLAQRAGIDPTKAKAWAMAATGSATIEGNISVLTALASENDRRRGLGIPGMTEKNKQEAMSLYSDLGDQTLGEKGRLLTETIGQTQFGGSYNVRARLRANLGLRSGVPGKNLDDIQRLEAARTPGENLSEMETRRQEDITAASVQEYSETVGIKERRGEAYRRQLANRNPGQEKVLQFLENIPGVGGLFEAAQRDVFQEKAEKAYGNQRMDIDQMKEVFFGLKDTILQTNRRPLPNMNSRTESNK